LYGGRPDIPSMISYQNGVPSWVDLSTSEPARAKTFYTTLFGWTYVDKIMGNGRFYSRAQLNGVDSAAIFGQGDAEIEQGIPARWNMYLNVDDIDVTASKVVSAGGTLIMDPFDTTDAGRMALFFDPMGAVVALWQSSRGKTAPRVVNEPGAVTWYELMTRDSDTASNFYADLFGWRSHSVDFERGDYILFHLDDHYPVGGMVEMDDSYIGVRPHWMVYFAVADCDAAVIVAVENAGKIVIPPTDIVRGRFAVLSDPQGATFAVMTVNEE